MIVKYILLHGIIHTDDGHWCVFVQGQFVFLCQAVLAVYNGRISRLIFLHTAIVIAVVVTATTMFTVLSS